jgi:DNA helicase IV
MPRRMVNTDNPEPVYIGRLGLTDSAGRRLLIDWRAPQPSRSSRRPTRTRWV